MTKREKRVAELRAAVAAYEPTPQEPVEHAVSVVANYSMGREDGDPLDVEDYDWVTSMLNEAEYMTLDNQSLCTVDDWLCAFRDIGLVIERQKVIA